MKCRKEAGIRKLFDESLNLKDDLKHWEKAETVKQSNVFEGEQLMDFWTRAPDNAEFLAAKAISIVAMHGLERLVEAAGTKYSDVKDLGNVTYVQGLNRRKQNGPRMGSEGTGFAITNPVAREKLKV